ncbi:MAG: altronate dehydratase family protein [Deltaproteobacteria bacterium]|jgi:altronate hydrolase|nr:altronate dehydratase family protein [Deltaproteobacteria bacterium]
MQATLIHADDNVAVALEALKKDTSVTVGGRTITLPEDIRVGHKFAVKDLPLGNGVIKYGEVIGRLTAHVKKGQWVHLHNVKMMDMPVEYAYNFDNKTVLPGTSDMTFMGYERKDGKAGIRNYIAIIPTVYCCNGPGAKLAAMLALKYPENEHFDGFQILSHGSGCSQSGADLAMTSRVLANLSKNANFGGVLFLSLGCEINDFNQMMPFIGEYDPARTRFLTLQDVENEYDAGMKLCDELYAVVSKDRRKPLNISALDIGYNCGGSDGFSGITANRLVGMFTDRMTTLGGTTNLTEVPEMFGAEHILMNRAKDSAVFDKTVKMIQDFKAYFKKYGQDDATGNSVPGNYEGGLSTQADKSLGCIQKGGRSMVMDVVPHGGRITEKGFNIVAGPGADLPGITGQVAAGSVLMLFTTGRGTPAGFVGPLFRISSNNALYAKKPHWNDFNAGRLLSGEDPQALADELFAKIMETCEGKYRTLNEINGFYQMGIFKDGVIG